MSYFRNYLNLKIVWHTALSDAQYLKLSGHAHLDTQRYELMTWRVVPKRAVKWIQYSAEA